MSSDTISTADLDFMVNTFKEESIKPLTIDNRDYFVFVVCGHHLYQGKSKKWARRRNKKFYRMFG